MGLTFAVMIHQDASFAELVARWREAEAAGFDAAYVCDHTNDYRDMGGYWLEGWTVLAAVAATTSTIRIGPLVANPILRPPASLALTAVAVDHLSAGRLDLGVGTGIAGFDHSATGTPYWEPKERVARFREYVEILDGLLRASEDPFLWCVPAGGAYPPWYSAPDHRWSSPGSPQLSAGSPPSVRMSGTRTARSARTRRRSSKSPSARTQRSTPGGPGRPRAVRAAPFGAAARAHQPVGRSRRAGPAGGAIRAAGATDFVLPWPADDAQRKVYDEAVTAVLPRLRA